MEIGFKIQLKPYEMFEIRSNDWDTIEECLSEIYHSLLKVDHPAVREFRDGSIFREQRCAYRFDALPVRAQVYAVRAAEKWEQQQTQEKQGE